MTFFSSRVIGRGAASDRGVATAVAIDVSFRVSSA
jgi:hypothetical protein